MMPILYLVITYHPDSDGDRKLLEKFGIMVDDDLDGYHIFDNTERTLEYLRKHGVDVKEDELPVEGSLGMPGRYLYFKVVAMEMNNIED